MKAAPIFADTRRLCEWLLGHFDDHGGVLAPRICGTALDLLEAVTLALKNRSREEQIDRADEVLIHLRVVLRLAETTELLNEEQTLYALEQADQIGRQLGGWRRSLGVV